MDKQDILEGGWGAELLEPLLANAHSGLTNFLALLHFGYFDETFLPPVLFSG